jgi:hypothetical protein
MAVEHGTPWTLRTPADHRDDVLDRFGVDFAAPQTARTWATRSRPLTR